MANKKRNPLKAVGIFFIAFGLINVAVDLIYQPRFYSKYNETKKSGLTTQTTDYSITKESASGGGNSYTLFYNFTANGTSYHEYNPVKIATPTTGSPLNIKYLSNDPGFNYPVVEGASATADHNTEIAISAFIFVFGSIFGGFLIWLGSKPGVSRGLGLRQIKIKQINNQAPFENSSENALVARLPFWFPIKDEKEIMHYNKGIVTLSKGMLEVTDESSGTVMYKYPLAPDIKVKRTFGVVVITFMNGKETKTNFALTPLKYQFYFYRPTLILLSFYSALYGGSKAKAFVAACKQAAGAA